MRIYSAEIKNRIKGTLYPRARTGRHRIDKYLDTWRRQWLFPKSQSQDRGLPELLLA